MPDKRAAARIEVFRPGTFTPMGGGPITFTAADLKAAADAYDPGTAPAPVVVGHPATDAPAFGWIEKLDYAAGPERLIATVNDIEPAFAAMVKDGRFRKVSMAFFRPDQAANPVPGTWYPRHVGFLGAAAPAVPGLRNAAFADAEGVTFTADFGAGEESASLFRGLRDFLIERFGVDDVEKVLPSWKIDWLADADAVPEPGRIAAGFAAPAPEPHNPRQEAILPQNTPAAASAASDGAPAAFAEREAALAAREAAIIERERAQAHEANTAFAENLVAEGRLLPANRDRVAALLDALPEGASVSFAEGAAPVGQADALRAILSSQPAAVSFGAADLGEGADPGSDRGATFAADGNAVDSAGLQLHARAMAWLRTHPDTDYITAVKAVS